MAKTPKYRRTHLTVKERNFKNLAKIQQRVKQAHKRIPKRKSSTIAGELTKPVKELSPYVLEIRARKAEIRKQKVKAAILRLLKEQVKEKARISADMRNRLKMEEFRTIYIESQLTKRIFKVPNYKARKYCTKWFIRVPKHMGKVQARLEREEHKTISQNKLELITSTRKIMLPNGFEIKEVDGKEIKGKQLYEEIEIPVEIYGIPIKVVKEREWGNHNPFNGMNRKERRSQEGVSKPIHQPGNSFIKKQTIYVVPKKIEEQTITWLEPQYEYIKEEFNFYEKVDNLNGGKTTHPKIKTDKLIGTVETLKKVFKGLETKTRTIMAPNKDYYKTIKTLQLPGKKGFKVHKFKQKVETLKQTLQTEKPTSKSKTKTKRSRKTTKS